MADNPCHLLKVYYVPNALCPTCRVSVHSITIQDKPCLLCSLALRPCTVLSSPSFPLSIFPQAGYPRGGESGTRCLMQAEVHSKGSCVLFPARGMLLPSLTLLLMCHSALICCCSVAHLCPTIDCSTPGFPVLHHLPEFAQTHFH